MKRFDNKGMMIFPEETKPLNIPKKLMVVSECFCPNGHNLINSRAVFNNFKGILLKIVRENESGLVAISPIHNDKSKISLDIDLKEGEIYELRCPICDATLPIYSSCECGASLIGLFLDKNLNFADSIVVCNRIGCTNSDVRLSSQILEENNL